MGMNEELLAMATVVAYSKSKRLRDWADVTNPYESRKARDSQDKELVAKYIKVLESTDEGNMLLEHYVPLFIMTVLGQETSNRIIAPDC